jgi:large subunit ribosomal protein L6
MSRIGRAPIALPKGVSFEQIDGVVSVKGPKGNLSVPLHPEISVAQEDGNLVVSRPSDSTRHKSLHG